MKFFEPYLEEFSQSIDLGDFLLNLLISAILLTAIKFFYIRFGTAVSNRRRFSNNFLPLGLTTMLIITIIKGSIALSLGLVGALSIVRFRAAIKDPEELTFLFLSIAVGLAAGANQPFIAVVALVFILLVLFIDYWAKSKANTYSDKGMYLHVEAPVQEIQVITDILSGLLPFVELKRMDHTEKGINATFLVRTDSVQELDEVGKALREAAPGTEWSVIDQPSLAV